MKRSRHLLTLDDLMERVVVCPSGCYLWAGGDDGYGDHLGRGAYGRILRPGTRLVMPAHRYIHEQFIGPIPFGYDVDHMCAAWAPDPLLVTRCVRPEHLQAIPPILNQQLKIIRRKTFGMYDMFCDEPPITREIPPPPRPLLAPGECEADLWL
ncbi:HNH endonuclease [Tardiphaga sp.]|jgi:hypothetical protein|uniref:HNH endonuclease n=1 Tax=Tardiphaga sp. TaxID=1926292 RepID=UPI0037DA1BA5